MDLPSRLRGALQHARGFTDRLLSEFEHDEDFFSRPTDGTHHAMWIAGHLAVATNFFIRLIDPTRRKNLADINHLFGKGSQLLDDPSRYPAPAEICTLLTERGNAFVDLLDDCEPSDLNRPVTAGPPFMPDVGAVFQMAAWHEALHAGQLSVVHRMLGKTPLADRT